MRKRIWEYEDFNEYKKENSDTFKDHKAFLTNIGKENECIISFENPKCSEGAMKFVYVDGVITVQGYYGNACFNWHNPKNHILSFGTFNDIGYVLSKLEVATRDGIMYFDSDLYHKDLSEFLYHKEDSGYDLDNVDEEPHIESYCQAIQYMNDNYDAFGGNLEAEEFELGMYVSERAYLWWFGLQEALKQLDEQGVFNEKKDYRKIPYIKGFEPEDV